MLGLGLVRELERRGLPYEAPDLDRLDLLHGDPGPLIAGLRPAALVNPSAFTDVGGAERPANRKAVDRLNRDAPGEMARACARLGIPMLHVSTDFVFDGKRSAPYREHDRVNPLQAYGRSKLQGERAVLEAHPQALVVRTSTLFGPGRPLDRPHYVDAILRQARARSKLSVVRLPVSSPTYAPDLAQGMLELLLAEASGLVHFANHGACSRLELARESVRIAGLADAVAIEECPAPVEELARPDYSVLDTTRFTELTGHAPRPWQDALREYIATLGA
jgi:dTDP-4-dehydrorhamnose reductase